MNTSNEQQPATPVCEVCRKAEQMGGAIRCMACGRWVPRSDKGGGYGRQPDRRRNREPNPSCPRCPPDLQSPRATIRLPYRLFFKCDRCLSVWSLDLTRS